MFARIFRRRRRDVRHVAGSRVARARSSRNSSACTAMSHRSFQRFVRSCLRCSYHFQRRDARFHFAADDWRHTPVETAHAVGAGGELFRGRNCCRLVNLPVSAGREAMFKASNAFRCLRVRGFVRRSWLINTRASFGREQFDEARFTGGTVPARYV